MPDGGMTVSFDEIPFDWRVPGFPVEVAANYNQIGVQPIPTRILFIGQATEAGIADPLTIHRMVSDLDAKLQFGPGSVLAQMVKAFRDANKTQDVYAMFLPDDEAGVAAKATLTLTGLPTVTAPLVIYIGGRRVRVAANAADTVAVIAGRLASAVNAAVDLIVTAAAVAGVVTLTAKHKGSFINDLTLTIGVNEEAPPAGLTVFPSAFALGAANPELLDAFAAIGDEWFTDIAVPYNDAANLTAFAAYLSNSYNAMAERDAHGYYGFSGTLGQQSAFGNTQNSKFMSYMPVYGSDTPPWEWAASLAGRCAFHLTNDPSRQLKTIDMPGIKAPPLKKRFTQIERDFVLRDGGSTFTVDQAGTVIIERVITTYQMHPSGFEDTAWLDIMRPKVATRIRYDWKAYLNLNLGRHKLASDGSAAVASGQPVVTPRIAKGLWASRCRLYEQLGWIENVDFTIEQSIFALDGTDHNRMNSRPMYQQIGNLMILAGRLEFLV